MADKWYFSTYSIILFFVIGAAIATSALFLMLIPQSGEIIRLAEWRMMRVQSMKIETNLQYHGTRSEIGATGQEEKRRRDMSLDLSGVMSRGDGGEVNGDYDFNARFGSDGGIVIGGNYRQVAKANFIRLTELPEQLGGINVGVFRDKTLRVNFNELLSATTLPFVGGARQLDEYDRAYLLSEIRQTPFLTVDEKLKDVTMHGIPVHHYKITPEKLYLREFILLAEQLRLDQEPTSRDRLGWDIFFSHVEPVEGEIWIGANDYLIHRISLQFKYDDGKEDGVLAFTADFSEFNRVATVSLPSDGDIEDAGAYAQSLLGGLVAHLPMAKEGTGNRQQQVSGSLGSLVEADAGTGGSDDDDDGLPAFLELFYGSDVLNPDTDGDGAWDGREVDTGWSPTGPWRLFDFTFGAFD